MQRTLSLAVAGALALGVALPAQGGTIRSGNVDYVVTDVPDTTSSQNGTCVFTARRQQDVAVAIHHWWYYRVAGDGREFPLNTGDTNGDGSNTQGYTENYTGDLATLLWSDVDERGLFSARLQYRAISTGPRNGLVMSRLTLTNTSANPVTLDVFAHSQWDLCTNNDPHMDVTGSQNNTRLNFLPDPALCTFTNMWAQWVGVGSDRYEIAHRDHNNLLFRLCDGNLTNLTNTALPWHRDDHQTCGFQWTSRTIQSGQSMNFVTLLANNEIPCELAATATNYGAGSTGSNGVPLLIGVNPPIIGIVQSTGQDNQPKLRVINGLQNGAASLSAGFGRTNIVLGNVTLLTSPVASIPLALDGTGAAEAVLAIPANPALCGALVDFQALILDPGVVGLFPVSHSDGLEWRLGGY